RPRPRPAHCHTPAPALSDFALPPPPRIPPRPYTTLFRSPGVEDAVPTLLELAAGVAAVAVHVVRVVALLALDQTAAAVPAEVDPAPRTAIARRRIPVVALLPGVEDAVPTLLELAAGVAAVAVHVVRVVALLALDQT